MAVKISELLGTHLTALRYEPTAKRLRAEVDGHLVADTLNGMLVWEPKRLVPTYAIAEQDFSAKLIPTSAGDSTDTTPVLDPSNPFAQRITACQAYDIEVADRTLEAAAFRADDPDLANHLILDFNKFDWREEEEPIVAHPHDPFHRIDILRSSRQVRIELNGELLAESTRPVLLFETLLPVRFYLPAEDLAAQFEPSDTISYCAYKGRASYLSLPGKRNDVAWTYPEPLRETEPVRDLVCFFDEYVDVFVDGERRDRPATPWSE
jgi:uncharacterized protein (DUF427 family)